MHNGPAWEEDEGCRRGRAQPTDAGGAGCGVRLGKAAARSALVQGGGGTPMGLARRGTDGCGEEEEGETGLPDTPEREAAAGPGGARKVGAAPMQEEDDVGSGGSTACSGPAWEEDERHRRGHVQPANAEG